jgi:hypothetical protein
MFNVGIFLILLLSSALILVYSQVFTHQSIILLALQSAQAQENSLENGIDLNGIWKRDDGVQVYITQTGSQVISSFETEGNEREGDCSFAGMANVKTYLDFDANIEGNQLTGETNVCVIEVNNVQLYPMHLTISNNGNTLTGTYEYKGGRYPISYIKTTTTFPPMLNSLPPAVLNFGRAYITNPNTDKVLLPVALGNFAWNYVKASNTDPVSLLAGLGAVFAAIVAGSYAIKKIHKHSKSHKKGKEQKEEQKLHVIRLAINCGLENIIEEAKEIENLQSINEIKRIEKEFRTVLGAILEGREKLKKLQKAKDFVEWCREAKEDPNTIISKISNDIIGNFIGCIEPYFASLFLKSISIESQTVIINNDKDTKDQTNQNRYVNFNAKFNLKPLEPFIKLTLLIDEVPTSSVRLIFSIDTSVSMKNAKVYSTNEGTKIVVDSINIVLQLSFSRLVISHYLNKSIEMPIVLGKKEFGIKSLPVQ